MQSSPVHTLMTASNVLADSSPTGARQVSTTPARPNKDPCCRAQPAAITLSQLKKLLSITYNKPTRCNSGSIVFIKNYEYALHVSDALCVHLQEHYKL